MRAAGFRLPYGTAGSNKRSQKPNFPSETRRVQLIVAFISNSKASRKMTSNTGAMAAASKGTVLVVLSSSDHVTLEGGKTEPSGFFMNELCIPLTMLLEHGWSVEFANPKGEGTGRRAAVR